MNPGDILHGFELKYSQPLPEIKATLHRFTYQKNGADTIWLERDDDNKSFGIAFRTVPSDDTGVFHILEHSVLNGSEKYPLREPFVDLLKSSLATFLNAMTFPDMTMYPVSSRNDKDFLNLMDVYMDAVLHPLSLHDPHSFRQEGWHYELESPEGELTVNGVVFNEMKGAYTSQDELIRDRLNRLMFPDSCYGKDSGGDPDHIPELTYENYLANHRRFYHPSNSYIFLDGSVDLDAAFAKLDGFLKDYERIDPDSEIALQKPVNPAECTACYPIGEEDDDSNKALLGRGWVYGRFDEYEKNLAVSVLTDVLAGSNDAPLTRALLEKGLCEDVSLEKSEGGLQSYVRLILKNCDPAKKDEIWALVDETLHRLAEEGLDKKRIRSELSRMEFLNREKDFGGISKGLVYGIDAMNSWLYGGDPAQALQTEMLFKPLNDMVDAGGFEALLKEVLIDCGHTARVVMLPSKTMAEEKRAAEQKRLAALKASWTAERVQQTIDEFTALRLRQSQPDTPEQQAKLPRLSLADIPQKRQPLPCTVKEFDGCTMLHEDIDTSGISYLTLYFSLADFDAQELSRAAILTPLIGNIATENYDVAALRSETNEKLGRFAVHSRVFSGAKKFGAYAFVTIAVLESHKADAIRLVDEILNRSRFEDEAYILNLLRQSRISLEQRVMMSGNAFASIHAAAAFSPAFALHEAVGGMGMLRQLQKEEKEFGAESLGWMKKMAGRIFSKARLTLNVTSALDEDWVRRIVGVLPASPMGKAVQPVLETKLGCGYLIPSQIGFAARSAQLAPQSQGAALVASQLLTYDFLWNEVRVKGGAYGTRLSVSDSGVLSATSYRDPSAAQSLQTFMRTADALRAVCDSDADLTQYIISTIGNIDPLRTPVTTAAEAAAMYFGGTTEEDRSRTWQQVLATGRKELRAFADELQKGLDASNLCVVGGKEALDACGDKLTGIESVQ